MVQKSKIESRRIFENSSGPSFRTDIYRNYSLAAPVPVLQGFPTKFLQKIEWKKVACRWRFFETVVLSVTLHDIRREADNPYHFRPRAVPQDGHASEEIERSQRK